MDFQTREIIHSDIEMINNWRLGWRKNLLPIELYPSTGLVLLSENGEELMAGFVWTSNAAMVQIGLITRNPIYKKLPSDSKEILIRSLIDYCKTLGYSYIMSWCGDTATKETFKKIGFTENSSNVSEFIGKII